MIPPFNLECVSRCGDIVGDPAGDKLKRSRDDEGDWGEDVDDGDER